MSGVKEVSTGADMSASLALVGKLQSRQAKVGIIGLGYVGLPLAVAFAEAGFSVHGTDTDDIRVASLNAGRSDIPDISLERLAALATYLKRLCLEKSPMVPPTTCKKPMG